MIALSCHSLDQPDLVLWVWDPDVRRLVQDQNRRIMEDCLCEARTVAISLDRVSMLCLRTLRMAVTMAFSTASRLRRRSGHASTP